MAEKSFDAAEHFGAKLSAVYDERIRELFPGYETMHAVAQYLLAAHAPEQATILIVGAGTGHEAVTYASGRPGWRITGVEPSASMLRIAREKIESLAVGDRVELIHGTVRDVPRRPAFDGAASILVLQFLADDGRKEIQLREIAERLRPGAGLVVIDFEGDRQSPEYHLLLAAWQAHQFATRRDRQQVERDLAQAEKNLRPVSEARMRELLTGTGFRDICKFYKSLLVGGYCATRTTSTA